MATNRKLGNDFEQMLCEILSDNGFWVHNFALKQAGQPADIIAVENGTAYLIDAKVCSNGRFSLSRIEDNQKYAMELWEMCGNGTGWFAILLEDNIYMFPLTTFSYIQRAGATSMGEQDIVKGMPLEKWIRAARRFNHADYQI